MARDFPHVSGPSPASVTAVRSRPDNVGHTRQMIAGWLRLRLGLPPLDCLVNEVGAISRETPMHEVAGVAARFDGIDVNQDWDSETKIRVAMSGGTFPAALGTAFGAAVIEGFRGLTDTTAGWVSEVGVKNYLPNDRYRLSRADSLDRVPRGGTAGHAEVAAELETYRAVKYGKQIIVDEQDLIDDDLGMLRRRALSAGEAAKRLKLDLVYAILLANAAMQSDETPLFHADHGNVSTGAALAADKLAAGCAALEKTVEDGVVLGLKPGFLIVPSSLAGTSAGLARAIETASGNTSLAVRSEARLELGVTDPVDDTVYAGSASTWFLAARNGFRGVEVGYLDNQREPSVRRFELDKGQWGVAWDISFSVGAKAVDWRDLHRATA